MTQSISHIAYPHDMFSAIRYAKRFALDDAFTEPLLHKPPRLKRRARLLRGAHRLRRAVLARSIHHLLARRTGSLQPVLLFVRGFC